MPLTRFAAICAFTALISPVQLLAQQTPAPRILAIGDSLMAWHTMTGQSIADVVGRELGEATVNRSIGGARMIFRIPAMAEMGMRISSQYTEGDWDWVIVNGGGNDLWFGCGCKACEAKLDKLISSKAAGEGAIPETLDEVLESGAKVIYVGYMRSPGFDSVIDECRDEGDELERRIEDYLGEVPNAYFLSLKTLVPMGDKSYHALDRVHPSLKASREIGQRVADLIRLIDPDR